MELAPTPRPQSSALLTAFLALGVWVLLAVFPPSASRLAIWPWSLLTLAFWTGSFLVGLGVLRTRRGLSPVLDAGLVVLALAALISAQSGPLRGVAVPAAIPVVGACLLPFALLPWLSGPQRATGFRLIGWAVVAVLVASIALWFRDHVAPALNRGARLIDTLGLRNEQPFGHGNYTAAFALLALSWIGTCLVASQAPPESRDSDDSAARRVSAFARPGFWWVGLALGLIVLFSSGSRAGIGALAVGLVVAAALGARELIRLRPAARVGLVCSALGLVIAGIATNSRLRAFVLEGRWSEVASESNQQRLGMTTGALRLGGERPLFGWGPGTVPHVFPSVRAEVAGNVDNVLQVHSSLLQAWATLGAAGVLGAGCIAVGTVALIRSSRARAPARPGQTESSLLAGGLAGFAAFTFFDHSLDLPAIAALAAAHLAALAPAASASPVPAGRLRAGFAGVLLLGGLTLVPLALQDQRARRLHSSAMDAASRGDAAGYSDRLAEAFKILPDATYLAHLRASTLSTGQPFSGSAPEGGPAAAVGLLEATLRINPSLEYAHYNLGWLLLSSRPAEAERHFSEAARLAPHRVGVHLGLGLARASQGNAADAVRAFAAERINAPEQAFASLFRESGLTDLARDVRQRATGFLQASATAGRLPASVVATVLSTWENVSADQVIEGPPYRRVRPGYGVLMGFPEGRPPSDVNPMTALTLPKESARALPKPGWVPGRLLLELSLGPEPAKP